MGDKMHSMIFDNSKLRRSVPGWRPAVPCLDGAREIVAWHDEEASRQVVDEAWNRLNDLLIERVSVTAP
jgi:hypothetical protein